MIGPIRCFTCGNVIGSYWNKYYTTLESKKREKEAQDSNNSDTIINVNSKTIETTPEEEALNMLELDMYCCKRMMLGHVNLIDQT